VFAPLLAAVLDDNLKVTGSNPVPAIVKKALENMMLSRALFDRAKVGPHARSINVLF
jgi:hypothetical protein